MRTEFQRAAVRFRCAVRTRMGMAPGDRAFVSKVSFPAEQDNRVHLAEVAMRRVCSPLYIICKQL